ncbi:peroxisomal oxidase [Roridomyces roridus]|uniref:Acyl-coenzyme A oxidase n=1 Tax=Roridomyces roridus TaxID=1738132 RepID=A0AAD7BCS7_9AGAR|nr:peroxisomal oxidase [Roridomyces roridus]
MHSPHDASKQNAIDMAAARAKTSINVSAVRDFLYNGAAQWQNRERVSKILASDPLFNKSQRPFLTRKELYIRGQALTNRLDELAETHKWTPEDIQLAFSVVSDEGLPVTLHNIAFEPVFHLQASPELLSQYGDLIAKRGILGCYLQTELGHGTNVGRLETTATYIPETREFEIHSPTLTSTKWWIGALGKTSTHGVVQAKLILPGGKDVGPHLFFVQLRDTETHQPLPGRVLGDIGPKAMAGLAAIDNGFARFTHVRIPKSHMLSKFAGVTDEGKYVTPPHAKLSYGGMLYIRSGMVTSAGWLGAKAATVAIRYATVRRQGTLDPASGLESQVITYPSLHARLLPILARAYVFIGLGRALSRSFDALARDLSSGNTSQLADMHVMTSGLKTLVTTSSIQDVETARRSMGGHGYSAFAGLGKLYADTVPSATYEGENYVLDQQVLRASLKTFTLIFGNPAASPADKAKLAAGLPGTSKYLRLLLDPSLRPPTASFTPVDDVVSISTTVISLLEWRAAGLVKEAAQTHKDGTPDATATQRVAKAVTEAFVSARVGEMIGELPVKLGRGTREAGVVGKVYVLYLLTTLESALVDLLSFRLYVTPKAEAESTADPVRGLRLAIGQLCKELLPEAIGLTDAFGYSDWDLDSSLGVYDGRVYEALWARAQDEPLNQTEVTEAYEASIKPMMLRGRRTAGASAKL